MVEKLTSEENEVLSAGGFSNGELILIPQNKNSADTFMILFHEIGHNLDVQYDVESVIRETAEIKTRTILLSPIEANWLLEESSKGWSSTGVASHHPTIMQKILDVILVEGTNVKRRIKSIDHKEFNKVIGKTGIAGSKTVLSEVDTNSATGLEIVDPRMHRNLEMPADFVLELMFDVLNRSINLYFSLSENTKIFTTMPDARNLKTVEIARYLIKKNWHSPGFWHKKIKATMVGESTLDN